MESRGYDEVRELVKRIQEQKRRQARSREAAERARKAIQARREFTIKNAAPPDLIARF